MLQATGGIRNEVNTFLSDYAVPVIAMLLIVGVGIGVVMNYDKIIDRDGQGTRKEGIVNLLWVVGYIIIGLAIIAAVIALMDFQVRKGLETPLKVHGMRTKFFCIYCIILAVIVLFVVGFLTSAMSGEGSFLAFIVSLVAGAFASVVLRIVFINLSMQRKFGKFKRQVFVISNKDLLNSL